jgi:hypothetical protein
MPEETNDRQKRILIRCRQMLPAGLWLTALTLIVCGTWNSGFNTLTSSAAIALALGGCYEWFTNRFLLRWYNKNRDVHLWDIIRAGGWIELGLFVAFIVGGVVAIVMGAGAFIIAALVAGIFAGFLLLVLA